MRETWVRPLGLFTQPNEIGVYPAGAMSQAVDFVARAPGQLESRRASTLNHSGVGGSDDWVIKAVHTGSQLVYVKIDPNDPNDTQMYWVNGAGTSTAAAGLGTWIPHWYPEFSGWGDFVLFRDRVFYANAGSDVVVADQLNPTTTAGRTFRLCSMEQPYVNEVAGGSFTDAQALGPLRACGYAALLKRKFADGYEVVGPPSLIFRSVNTDTTDTYNPRLFVGWHNVPPVLEGDIVELYRTQSVDATVPDANPDPGTTCYLVAERTLTSTDIVNGYVDITDTAKDGPVGQGFGGLGRPMYTNPGQSGLEGANTPPPAARRMATYKGRMFYANYAAAADATFALRGGMGFTPVGDTAAAKSGVGSRQITVGVTNGSPTITGVSATEFLGIVTGQRIDGGFFPFNTYISSINTGAGTITANQNATSTNASAQIVLVDMIELKKGYDAAIVETTRILLFYLPYVLTSRTVSEDNKYAHDQAFYISNLYFPDATLELRATNGQNYDPPLPLITAINTSGVVTGGGAAKVYSPKRYKNGLRWSKDQQPEAVPPTNEIFVGQGEIYGMYSTRDALWIFASDGLWRLSGTMARTGQIVDVRVDPVDSTLILSCPTSGCVLRDSVYAYTNRGLVRVDDFGIAELSERRVGDLLPGGAWNPQPLVVLVADEANDDIYITIRTSTTLSSDTTYCYSTQYDLFTTCSKVGGFAAPTAYTYDVASRRVFALQSPAADSYIATNSNSSSWLSVLADFQPVFAEDPMALKQWIDATAVFGSNAPAQFGSGQVNPRWEKATETLGQSGNVPTATASQESRINYGVPRSAAVNNALVVGLTHPATSAPISLKALSLRFEYLTDQQVTR